MVRFAREQLNESQAQEVGLIVALTPFQAPGAVGLTPTVSNVACRIQPPPYPHHQVGGVLTHPAAQVEKVTNVGACLISLGKFQNCLSIIGTVAVPHEWPGIDSP